ncbi:HD-GYP domain-containing protein [Methylobacterium organophilum]|uniref:HD-GYP domain-containing protein n=1 Tax=Methylobacterium organophilum TaxID=410 RepID=A0ABQ4T2F8_METOR|nr:HD domain-containing phosphohydrolase [Methylobacterium organophilum]GJE25708.1 hypothetical protein LKMONMHP_0547 [Methylobacterium organophilum]
MKDRFVLVVSDRRERAERMARGIAVVLPCHVIEIGTRLPAAAPLAYVIDAALHPEERPAWAEQLAARIRSEDAPCLYLARGNGGSDTGTARFFRATHVLSPKSPSSGIVPLLMGAIAQRRERSTSRIEARIAAATGIVSSLFEAAAQGRSPSVEDADEGTQIVLDAISEVGIRAWLDVVWRHDITVYQHSLSVAGLSAEFAGLLGFSFRDRHRLAKAALLHDVGKARIPLAILNKPGPLDEGEMRVMRSHAALGAEMLAAAGTFEREIVDVARWHHERLDGSGYPDALTGAGISDLVRLVAICDVHSALTERRVYRPPMKAAEAARLMDGMAGQLDPDLLRAYRPIFARTAAERPNPVT